MNLTDYMGHTRAMSYYPCAQSADANEISYLVLGLIGEFTELESVLIETIATAAIDPDVCLAHRDTVLSELGDVCWYTFRLIDVYELYELQPVPYPNRTVSYEMVHQALGALANKTKNLIRDGLPPETIREHFSLNLRVVVDFIHKTCTAYGFDLGMVLDSNLKKLEERGISPTPHINQEVCDNIVRQLTNPPPKIFFQDFVAVNNHVHDKNCGPDAPAPDYIEDPVVDFSIEKLERREQAADFLFDNDQMPDLGEDLLHKD